MEGKYSSTPEEGDNKSRAITMVSVSREDVAKECEEEINTAGAEHAFETPRSIEAEVEYDREGKAVEAKSKGGATERDGLGAKRMDRDGDKCEDDKSR